MRLGTLYVVEHGRGSVIYIGLYWDNNNMALVLNLKCVENIHGKADRIARVAFRGKRFTRIVRNSTGKTTTL